MYESSLFGASCVDATVTPSVIPLSLHSRRRRGVAAWAGFVAFGFAPPCTVACAAARYLRSYAPPLRGGSSGERTHAAELRGDVAAWGDVSKVSKCMLA